MFGTSSVSAPVCSKPGAPADKSLPTRARLLADFADEKKPKPALNLLVRHGVRSCLEYARNFDLKTARSLSNPELAPHLEFVDLGGHGYAKVRLSADAMRTEFVCIPRPITRSEKPNGGPIKYRVLHTAALWKSGEKPVLVQRVLDGKADLCI